MTVETIHSIDSQIFIIVNDGLSSRFSDLIMPIVRNKLTWFPAYLLLAGWLIYKEGKAGAVLVLSLILAVVISDQLSSSLIKPLVGRLRPCHEPLLAAYLHPEVYCGISKSFTSSHAVNHFCLAAFLSAVFRIPRLSLVLGFWASLICLAQVYVGVHYPADVICGGLLGILIGLVLYLTHSRITRNTPYELRIHQGQ